MRITFNSEFKYSNFIVDQSIFEDQQSFNLMIHFVKI